MQTLLSDNQNKVINLLTTLFNKKAEDINLNAFLGDVLDKPKDQQKFIETFEETFDLDMNDMAIDKDMLVLNDFVTALDID